MNLGIPWWLPNDYLVSVSLLLGQLDRTFQIFVFFNGISHSSMPLDLIKELGNDDVVYIVLGIHRSLLKRVIPENKIVILK